jgi:hypothetical protein
MFVFITVHVYNLCNPNILLENNLTSILKIIYKSNFIFNRKNHGLPTKFGAQFKKWFWVALSHKLFHISKSLLIFFLPRSITLKYIFKHTLWNITYLNR